MSIKASLVQPAAANALATAAPIPTQGQLLLDVEDQFVQESNGPEPAPVITAAPWNSVDWLIST